MEKADLDRKIINSKKKTPQAAADWQLSTSADMTLTLHNYVIFFISGPGPKLFVLPSIIE